MKKYLLLSVLSFCLIKVHAQNNLAWHKVLINKNIIYTQLVINSKDEIFLIGIFKDSLEIDSQKIFHKINYGNGLFMAKFNSFHQLKWLKNIGNVKNDFGITGSKIDKEDNIVFVLNRISFAELYKNKNDTAKFYGLYDGSLLVKYSVNGDFIFGVPLHSKYGGRHAIGYSGNQGIAIDKNNNINICGVFMYRQGFDDTIYLANTMIVTDKVCLFYAQIDPKGKINWVHKLNQNNGSSLGLDIALDDENNSVITGILGIDDSAIIEGKKIVNADKAKYSLVLKINKNGEVASFNYCSSNIYEPYIHHLSFNRFTNSWFGISASNQVNFYNGDSINCKNSFIQEIDKNGNWGKQICIDTFRNSMICTNSHGDLIIDGVEVIDKMGNKIVRKSYNNGNTYGHYDMDINSKNEIYLLGATNFEKVNFDTLIISNNVPKRSELYVVKLSPIPTPSAYQFKFSIYPNPSNKMIHILSELVLIKSISILDMNGKKLMEANNIKDEKSFSVDISSLSIGMYFINAVSTGEVSTQKLIVK